VVVNFGLFSYPSGPYPGDTCHHSYEATWQG